MPNSPPPSRAAMDLKALVREVPDFPKKGILFKDLTPVWQDPAAFRSMVEQMAEPFRASQVELIAGIESRGLIIGSALALELGAGLVPVRKEGKLPWKTVRASYSLEYGEAVTELHRDAFKPGARVLIVDDLLATGGTAQAAVQLVKELEGKIVGLAFLVELEFLQGRQKLEKLGVDFFSLIKYT